MTATKEVIKKKPEYQTTRRRGPGLTKLFGVYLLNI